ncbi:DUF1343 domain-containing protein [Candidatus Dependentiae bacterium]
MVRGAINIFNNILSVSKIFLLFVFAVFLPRIFMTHVKNKTYCAIYKQKNCFKLGLENITSKFVNTIHNSKNPTCNVALITNQTGKDQLGRRSIDVLISKGIQIKKIFSPENGLTGNDPAVDQKTKLPIISLYSSDKTKAISKVMLKDIDLIIFDMQDAGMRNYTYITTLFQAIDAAYTYNKKIIVLDRPNLLGPIIEGPLVEKNFKSEISFAPIPLRYGMTIGEIALYYNSYIAKKEASLHIAPMKNYARDNVITNKLLSKLSPNITSIFACHGYSFLGLLGEISPFDIGIGTKNSFQLILLPDTIKFSKQKWQRLHKILKSYNIENHFYRFFDKIKKNYCSGLKLRIKNINHTASFKMLMDILKFFKENKLAMKFSKHFDKTVGTDKVKKFLENKISWKKLTKDINRRLFIFYNKAIHCFLYKPLPRVEYL